ncbi:MAG: MoxR family ATPase [Clostridia bacterium]|jgi:MoxR-like ATPases|nr:MoxR family ATPase [Clostridia bacterium]MBR5379712.1 MoxR family ATPase [Clostridia bacterium]MBR5750932.1 MoxR family ATPase [Clostridia bacterium]
MQPAQRLKQLLEQNIAKAVVGKSDAVELILNAILCGGHVLIEDVPGVGKTTLAGAFARSLALSFKRIQFTPDVTPSDVTGYTSIDFKTGEMRFREGAVFAQLILADEINRTSPKTQSSLLEVMQEHQVTIDGQTHALPEPFMVLATQNPVDFVGTYPLPEAQLDRFFMRVSIGYPSPEEEIGMLNMYMERDRLVDELEPVCTCEDLIRLQGKVGEVRVSREMRSYIVSIAQASRQGKVFERGISPRGAIALMRSAQAAALLDGREYVMPEDVRKMAAPVLSHRVVLSPEFRLGPKAITPEKALARLIAAVQVPVRVK